MWRKIKLFLLIKEVKWLEIAREIKNILIEQLRGAAVKAALSRWIIPFVKWVGVPVVGGALTWFGKLLVKAGFDAVVEPLITWVYLKGYRVIKIKQGEKYALKLKKAYSEGDLSDIISANMDTYN